jgi:hypothetical protein
MSESWRRIGERKDELEFFFGKRFYEDRDVKTVPILQCGRPWPNAVLQCGWTLACRWSIAAMHCDRRHVALPNAARLGEISGLAAPECPYFTALGYYGSTFLFILLMALMLLVPSRLICNL